MKKTWIAFLLALVLALAPCCMAQAEEAESPSPYSLGDVMEDFSAVLSDGTEVSLSGLLAEKKAVLINFWATWCGPCQAEFPFMQEAYDQVSDDIAIVALSTEPEDTDEVIRQYKADNGLTTLPMGRDNGLSRRFTFAGIPTSILVDSNGVICWMETGSIPSVESFLNLFHVFTDPAYTGPAILDSIPAGKPTAEPASSEALSAALNAQGGELVFAHAGNAYTWPFVVGEDGVSASNTGVNTSTARVDVTLTAEAGQALAYEYKGNTRTGLDRLQVMVNDEAVTYFSGEAADWATGCVTFPEAGEYTVSFRYVKGGQEMALEGESLSLRNVRLARAGEVLAPLPQLPRALEGGAVGFDVLTEDARIVELAFEGDFPLTQYAVLPAGDALDFRLLLGADVNPSEALCSFSGGRHVMVNTMPADETGYLVHLELPEGKDSYPLVLNLQSGVFSGNANAAMVMVYLSEDDMDMLVEGYTELFSLSGLNITGSWHYMEESRVVVPGVVEAPAQEDEGVPAQEEEGQEPESKKSVPGQYAVVVKDGEGNPVEGVMVQFCDDMTCAVVKTDATGTASFEGEPYAYEVHILKAPEGFAKVEDVFTLDANGETLEVTLTRAE